MTPFQDFIPRRKNNSSELLSRPGSRAMSGIRPSGFAHHEIAASMTEIQAPVHRFGESSSSLAVATTCRWERERGL
uniref:Uncharacterized protein n=1 Tax=Arundo donax TaxID=35708 RepID=A0A0A9CK25_ARUDO